MKKYISRVLMLVMSMVMLLTLASCGEKETSKEPADSQKTSEDVSFPSKLVAEKVGNVDVDYLYACEGGFYYQDRETKKYGIMTFDGQKDTGAIYASCERLDEYFIVSTKETLEEITDLNCGGVVDAEGKVIVPEQYASIDILNDRYIYVCEVTDVTENKDEALVYYSDSPISLSAKEGDILFKGNWYIYDIKTGQKVEGISGTTLSSVGAYGNYIGYENEQGEIVYVTAEGKTLPKNAVDIFEDGSYMLQEDGKVKVYDTNDSLLFTTGVDSYIPYEVDGDYYLAKIRIDDETKYVYMHKKTGGVLSAEYNGYPTRYGEFVHVDDCVYDFEGNKVAEGSYDSVYFDDFTNNAYILKNDEVSKVIQRDGMVIYEFSKEKGAEVSCFTFVAEIDAEDKCYSLKDKDFTIEGTAFAPWTVKVEKPNYIYDLVDVISGKTLISNYEGYLYTLTDDGYFVYAEKPEGGYDIYKVSVGK